MGKGSEGIAMVGECMEVDAQGMANAVLPSQDPGIYGQNLTILDRCVKIEKRLRKRLREALS